MNRERIKPWNAYTPSSSYGWWHPIVHQTQTGNVLDLSGQGAHGAQGADVVDGTMWGTPGWAICAESLNSQGFQVPAAKFTWDMANGDSFLLSFRAKDATAVSDGFVGNFQTGGLPGFRLLLDINGQIRPNIADGVNSAVPLAAGPDLSDGSEHVVSVAVDGAAKEMYMWGNGVALSLSGATNFDVSAVTGSTEAARVFGFGNDSITTDTVGISFSDIHMLVFPASGLPSNVSALVKLLRDRPYLPLTLDELGS